MGKISKKFKTAISDRTLKTAKHFVKLYAHHDAAEKQFRTFLLFIHAVKSGKKSIIFATDYVVLDMKSYESLITRQEKKKIQMIFVDEPAPKARRKK